MVLKGEASVTRRLRRNSFWKIVGDGSRGLLAVFLLLVARHYGPAAFGVFSLLYAAAIFFSLLADLGLNLLTTRQIAAHKSDPGAYLQTFFTCKLIILPLWVILPVLVCRLCPYPGISISLVALLAASFAMRNLLEFFGAIFSGFEQIQYEAVLKLAAHTLLLGLGIWFMSRDLSITWIGAAMLGGYLAAAVCGAVWCQSKWRILPLVFHTEGLAILYAEALPLILMGAGLAALTKWNTLMLGFFGVAAAQIGWFSASEKVIAALEVLPMLVTAASYPVLSDLHKNDPAGFASAKARLLKTFLGIGLLAGAAITLSSGPMIRILYGASYAGARPALCLLAFGLTAAFPNCMLLNILVASGRSADGARAALIACGANILLTLVLIPAWGINGSALASTLAQVVLFAAGYAFAAKARTRPAAVGTPA
ncbi:MAG: oligosaccharide flippase family protein [Elusimicrobia bacterium]|nr:oligosaccharide flippase family protein [Elusimicrobiota bacterium]